MTWAAATERAAATRSLSLTGSVTAGTIAPPALERVALVFEVVYDAAAWLDAHNGRTREEVTHPILKLVEEVGEVAQARIGQLGQNPRKGVTHSRDDVAAELADVVVTALVALQSLDLDPATVLVCKAQAIAARLERLELTGTEVTP